MKIRWAAVIAGAATVLAAGGCASAEQPAGDTIRVAASTNVWGSVAAAVGGDLVEVTAIVSDAAGDPHSYQLTPRDAATLTGADLVVSNGGGYDDFVGAALGDAGREPGGGPMLVEAAAVVSGDAGSAVSAGPAGDVNEHVWYRLAAVAATAGEIADRLQELRPESADTFRANAESFQREIDRLATAADRIADAATGRTVVATEPIAQYLLADAGLRDVTPAAFVQAVEEETDPPAAAVAEIQDLITGGAVTLVVYNPQTETPVVTDVVAKARAAGLPVVELTETLPAGQDYLTWMAGQIDALAAAATR